MFASLKAWAKKHRKGIFITISVLAIAGGVVILAINGKKVKVPIAKLAEDILPKVSPELAKGAADIVVEVDGVMKTFPRSEFIRTLHEGWQASATKVAQAAEMGISLNPGETIVNACMVSMKVA